MNNLIRVTAYCLRCHSNSSKKEEQTGTPNAYELKYNDCIIKINDLKNNIKFTPRAS